MSDLNTLIPTKREVRLREKAIEISPFKFSEFGLACKFIQRIREQIGDIDGDVDLFNLMAKCGEEVKGICVLASHQDSEFIETLELDDAVKLIGTIIEVNKDFFTRNVRPAMSEMIKRISDGATSA